MKTASAALRRHLPQLLDHEQYNIKTASAALRRHLPQLLNDESGLMPQVGDDAATARPRAV